MNSAVLALFFQVHHSLLCRTKVSLEAGRCKVPKKAHASTSSKSHTWMKNSRLAKSPAESGKRLFTAEEFLTARQIRSYFSRKASKLRNKTDDNDEERANENVEAAEEQEAYFQTRNEVLENVQLNHPIMYDTYNFCSMVKKDSLKRLTVALLQDICEHFGLDTTGASKKRKAPFIRLIRVELVQTCSSSFSK